MTTADDTAIEQRSRTELRTVIERAKDLLSGEESSAGDPLDCRRARALLEPALADDLGPVDDSVREAALTLARSWYDDGDLNPQRGADEALAVLNGFFDLRHTEDIEVLTMAGKIHRRRWELSAQWRELRRALFIYDRADSIAWTDSDVLRAARVRLEAAFLLDTLARQEERAFYDESKTWARRVPVLDADNWLDDTAPSAMGNTAVALREEAAELRHELVARLEQPGNQRDLAGRWEYSVALAEANVGLRNYEDARQALEAGAVNRPDEDERLLQDQARRLIELSRMRGIRPEADSTTSLADGELAEERAASNREALAMHRVGRSYGEIAETLGLGSEDSARAAVLDGARTGSVEVVSALLQQEGQTLDHDLLHSAFRGRLGLALSGGGFRASLFHIGVLARLAEEGLLPDIQVISCVSGGSILGAQYYLLVKELLETTTDDDLKANSTDHYIRMVQSLVDRYDEVMQSSLRARIFLNPLATAGLWPSPSRRMGRLLHKTLLTGPVVDLRDIVITPRDWTSEVAFKPRRHNWRRAHKVPMLILNATSLNTGHNWQFTSRYVGEPPALIPTEIDSGARLGRFELVAPRRGTWSRLRDRLPGHDEPQPDPSVAAAADAVPINLGEAVAASAAVPGLFQPIQLAGLYPDWLLKLADGGVVDNQGIGGLLDQGCDTLFVSDASRQLRSSPAPAGGLGPVFRSNSIAYHRIRAGQYDELRTRRRSGLVRDFLFVHLNRSLDGPEIAPLGDDRRPEADTDGSAPASGPDPDTRWRGGTRSRLRLASRRAEARLRPPDWAQQMALAVLSDTGLGMTVTEVARDIPSASDRRIAGALASLEAEGHVDRSPGSDLYRISPTGEKLVADPCTGYGIARYIQTALAQIRTDLNTFTQAERSALMASGYLMTGEALAEHGGVGPFRLGEADADRLRTTAPDELDTERWPFLRLVETMGVPTHELATQQHRLERHLREAAVGTRLQRLGGAWAVVLGLLGAALTVAVLATQDVISTRAYNLPIPRLAVGIVLLSVVAGAVSTWWPWRKRRASVRPLSLLTKLPLLVIALFLAAHSLLLLVAVRLPDPGRLERFVRAKH